MQNKKALVYLSGPMAGLTFEQALNGWRKAAAAYFIEKDIIGINPGRGKNDRFDAEEKLAKGGYERELLTSAKGITTRDLYDLKRSDFMLLHLSGATAVGIGSMIEVGWAHALGIPIVLVMEREGNIHEHCILDTCCALRTPFLDEALDYIWHCVDLNCLYNY